jgi:hypothetical protein
MMLIARLRALSPATEGFLSMALQGFTLVLKM